MVADYAFGSNPPYGLGHAMGLAKAQRILRTTAPALVEAKNTTDYVSLIRLHRIRQRFEDESW
jgi:hypothetical protein